MLINTASGKALLEQLTIVEQRLPTPRIRTAHLLCGGCEVLEVLGRRHRYTGMDTDITRYQEAKKINSALFLGTSAQQIDITRHPINILAMYDMVMSTGRLSECDGAPAIVARISGHAKQFMLFHDEAGDLGDLWQLPGWNMINQLFTDNLKKSTLLQRSKPL